MLGAFEGAFAAAFCAILTVGIWRYQKARRLPPGPSATLFGNAHHLRKTANWVPVFKKLADQYGPIICIWMLNAETFVLNDYATATALLDHRSSIYSSRPTVRMTELAGRADNIFSTKSTNPRFRIYRTLLHKTLNPRAIQTYHALQIEECQTLLRGLLETPDNFIAHVRRNAVAVIMSVAYGYRVNSSDDQFVAIVEEVVRRTNLLNVPGKFWVEFLPILRYVPQWLPGAGFKRLAQTSSKEMARLESIPYSWAKSQVLAGSYHESFISDHIHDEEFAPTAEEREDILKWCAAGLYTGAGDTTVSVTTTFFLLMALHPEIQERAREEIDAVVGGNMATYGDRSSLPYVNAMIKEVLRWGPVGPLGLPHQNTEDDYFNGYFIPRDTRIIANLWAMAYDENVYPNPSTFDPTRFLGEEQQLDPLKFIFGFGRRICPGIDLAEASLFLNLTNVLANFIISKKQGVDGQEIEPKVEWIPGMITHLKPFPCQIVPRSLDVLQSMLSATGH